MFDKRREMKSQIFQYLSNYIEINFDGGRTKFSRISNEIIEIIKIVEIQLLGIK